MEELSPLGYKIESSPREGLNVSLALVIGILLVVLAVGIAVLFLTNRITDAIKDNLEKDSTSENPES